MNGLLETGNILFPNLEGHGAASLGFVHVSVCVFNNVNKKGLKKLLFVLLNRDHFFWLRVSV